MTNIPDAWREWLLLAPRPRNPHDATVDHWLKERVIMQPLLRYASHVEEELHKARQAQKEWGEHQ